MRADRGGKPMIRLMRANHPVPPISSLGQLLDRLVKPIRFAPSIARTAGPLAGREPAGPLMPVFIPLPANPWRR